METNVIMPRRTRQTSIDCYHQIKAEGLLDKLLLEAYEIMYECAPCTASEAFTHAKSFGTKKSVMSQFRARLTELFDRGVIYPKSKRKCNITNRTVIEWDLTDNLPTKSDYKAVTTTQKIKELRSMLVKSYERTTDLVSQMELNDIILYIDTNLLKQ